MNKKFFFFFFLAPLLVVVILWSLLFPGYILSLDMTFMPSIPIPSVPAGAFVNTLPIKWILYGLGLLIPGWAVQKIVLIALFTLIPLIAYRCLLPKEASTPARLFAALFYTLNPFVYTRLLAGHWMHLFAYALLPWILALSLKWQGGGMKPACSASLARSATPAGNASRSDAGWHSVAGGRSDAGRDEGGWPERHKGIVLGIVLALTFAFSLHIGIMALLVVVIGLIARTPKKRTNKQPEQQSSNRVKRDNLTIQQYNNTTIQQSKQKKPYILLHAAIALFTFIILTSYWTIPYLSHPSQSILTAFNASHEQAFMTASDIRLGTVGNVLALYGFWGEREPWAQQFIWVKSYPWIFTVAGLILSGLVIFGFVRTIGGFVRFTKRPSVKIFMSSRTDPSPRGECEGSRESRDSSPLPSDALGAGYADSSGIRNDIFGERERRDEKRGSCETRRQGIAMAVIACLALILSCGVAATPFQPINAWLFDHIGFWRGFRDTQKWSALLVLAYAYFGGMGLSAIRKSHEITSHESREDRRAATIKQSDNHVQRNNQTIFSYALTPSRPYALVLAFLAIPLYTFPMLFGFWGQLRPVWYPEAWAKTNDVLKRDTACKAIFLPWHGYIPYGFTNNILVSNPASYFRCSMVTSRQVELGAIENQSLPDPAYDAIDGVVTGRDGWTPEQAADLLRSAGIRYVIYAHDVPPDDPWTYGFLNAPALEKTDFGEMTVYRL